MDAAQKRPNAAQYDDPSLPQPGDRAVYQTARKGDPKVKGTVQQLFSNGRIQFQPDNGTKWLSLPQRFQKRVEGKQYGLTFVE